MQKRKVCTVSDCNKIGYNHNGLCRDHSPCTELDCNNIEYRRSRLCSKHLISKHNEKAIHLMRNQYNLCRKGLRTKSSNEIKAKIEFEQGLVIAKETNQPLNARALYSLATLAVVQGDKISAREHANTILENSDASSREIELTKQFLKSLN